MDMEGILVYVQKRMRSDWKGIGKVGKGWKGREKDKAVFWQSYFSAAVQYWC